jgi:hypothetical protein
MRTLLTGILVVVTLAACGGGGGDRNVDRRSEHRVSASSLDPRFRTRPEPIVQLAPNVWRDAKGYVFGLGKDCKRYVQAHPGRPGAWIVGVCY